MALFLYSPLDIQAEDVEFYFEADINWSVSDKEGTLLCLGEEFGDVTTLTGRFSYDRNTEPVYFAPEDLSKVIYYQDTEFYGLRIEGGGIVFETVSAPVTPGDNSPYLIYIHDAEPDSDSEYFVVYSYLNETSAEGVEISRLDFRLTDLNGDAIESIELPNELKLEDWDYDLLNTVYFQLGCENMPYAVFHANPYILRRVYPSDDLGVLLDNLIASDLLGSEQSIGLLQKFNSAMTRFDSEHLFQACQQFQAFICQLDALSPMFDVDEDMAELVEDALELAGEMFEDRCEEQLPEDQFAKIMECPMAE
jgi:hypothetical protein